MKQISVVIPIYNSAPHLQGLIDQLDAQTFRDFATVFVCDASPDQSEILLPGLLEKANFEHSCVLRKERGGIGPARDYALDNGLVQGEFVLFLDADDEFPSDYLERLWKAAQAENADMVVCAFDRLDAKTGALISREMTHYPAHIDIERPTLELALINPAPWNKLIRVSKIGDCRFIAPFLEDALFLLKIIPCLSRIAFIPDPLYRYKVYPDSNIAQTDERKVLATKDGLLQVRDFYDAHPQTHAKMYDLFLAFTFLRLGIGMTTRACLAAQNGKARRRIARENRKFLYTELPNWPKCPLLRLSSLKKLGFKGLFLFHAKCLIRMNWFTVFVFEYRIFTKLMKKDIKW